MTDLAVVDTTVEPFDAVELDPSGRVEHADGRLVAVHDADADTTKFRVALFQYDASGGGSSVDLPDGAVVLDVGGGTITALVPADAYTVGAEQ